MDDDAGGAIPTVAEPGLRAAMRRHQGRLRRIIGAVAALALGGVLASAGTTAQALPLGWAAGGATTARLGDLAPGDRDAVLGWFGGVLSAEGYLQLQAAMDADDELAAWVGAGGRSDYLVTVLTDPAVGSAFVQLAGPELAINVIATEGRVVVAPEVLV